METESRENRERSYIAFISYRHTPLDREAAARVQKKIERFIVPKELRGKSGGKHPGICFRDEDELPASSSLSDSIYYALDHSEFLIVICSPDLPHSKWCEAEIRYFLKTHDRSHLLAVLTDGTPEEAFSPYMLHDFDDNGNIIKDWEPLAANIAGGNHSINNKTLKKETTRLCAAMIGCSFDDLWQREKRANAQRFGIAAAGAVAVMAVFLGVVLNRNAEIEERNAQITLQNEQITLQKDEIEEKNTELQSQLSSVLVDSGLNKLENFDRYGAIEDALSALESNDPAVYDHRAEKLLSDALGAYSYGKLQSTLVYEQTTDIVKINVTDDDRYVLLLDMAGTLRAHDMTDL
ncbi:MAG: toll/interleukin-1 receptor domain-containing protein, partial [Lachnospiraceae bacterium]|nr:toll/interleukin-1 receptor domain-containing protein [Lachnospiraceae bacterium]